MPNGKMIVPGKISNLFGKKVFLSSKSTPSCMLLKGMGDNLLRNRDALNSLLEMGFPLVGLGPSGWENITYSKDDVINIDNRSVLSRQSAPEERPPVNPYIEEDVRSDQFSANVASDDQTASYDVDPNLAAYLIDNYSQIRIKSDDFFDVSSAKVLAGMMGKQSPIVLEWISGNVRIQDPVPLHILRKGGYDGKSPLQLARIKDTNLIKFVIFEHTFWGSALERMSRNPNDGKLFEFSTAFKKRINAFIDCKDDPSVQKKYHSVLQVRVKPPSLQQRIERLIECLKTVDGMFIQRFLINPTEGWTWEKFDMYILGNLSVLITDEFLDGELTALGMQVPSNYSALKGARKLLKHHGHLESDDFRPEGGLPDWLNQLEIPWRSFKKADGHRKTMILGLLSQTRGAGRPPPIVLLQSKEKFLKIVSAEPPPLEPGVKELLHLISDTIVSEIKDEHLTGMQTAARITVSSAACYERMVSEDGTAQAINDLVWDADAGRKVKIYDLWTGKVVKLDVKSNMTAGEYIFWRCLEEVLKLPLEELTKISLVMVTEPGKARSVTKGRACLKIVLDVVNKLVAKPFIKAFPTSASGMEKSNHGWNFFKGFFMEPGRSLVFDPVKVETKIVAETYMYESVYKPVFCSSTDFDTATDWMRHDVASILANRVMSKCGIPSMLRGIVNACCFNPRTLEFSATGELAKFGKPISESRNAIQVVNGVMMGDPLTKIVLHMVNMCVRRSSLWFASADLGGAENASALRSAFLDSCQTVTV